MKVRFIKDKEYDGFMIWQMLKSNDPAGAKNRAKLMKISEDRFEKIRDTRNFDEAEEYVKEMVEERYEKSHKQIEDALKSYQHSWDEINDVFSERIEQITGHRWKFDEYLVVLSPFHPGVSNRNNNKIIRWIFEDLIGQRRITAHEILMIHIWDILDERFPDYCKSQDPKEERKRTFQLWALNEITTVAILGLEPELNELWSDKTRGFDKFLANYPQLADLKTQFKDVYLKKANFRDYLDKAVALLEKDHSSKSFGFADH